MIPNVVGMSMETSTVEDTTQVRDTCTGETTDLTETEARLTGHLSTAGNQFQDPDMDVEMTQDLQDTTTEDKTSGSLISDINAIKTFGWLFSCP